MTRAKPSLSDRAEYVAALAGLILLRLVGPRAASNLGGRLLRAIGPLIPVSRTAHKNLAAAMPELSRADRRRIVAETWENLGRTIAELAHLGSLRETPSGPGYRISGAEHLRKAAASGRPSMILTGHIGNWEVIPAAASACGMELGFVYRAASNVLVDALITRLRGAGTRYRVKTFAKGSSGARGAYAHLLAKGNLAMLVDQKLDSGIAVPFFNMAAMTAPGLAAFALKLHCLVIPVHVVREGPARLHVICEAPLTLPNTGNRQADTLTLMTTANAILERWIREVPGSWLWLHRRWPKPGALDRRVGERSVTHRTAV